MGKLLIKILATAVIPEILQSDNGGEFTARCIELMERHYPTIHIVKGHPRHPQSQGCVERGNGPFKEALDVWISQNPSVSWAEVRAYVVNAQINDRSLRQKGGKSPYEIYYGKQTTSSMNSILTMEITMQAKTEYGLKGIQWLMEQVGKMNPDVMINTGDITIWLNRLFTPIKSNVSGVNVAVGK